MIISPPLYNIFQCHASSMFLFITFNLINLANIFQGKQGDIICEQIVAKLATKLDSTSILLDCQLLRDIGPLPICHLGAEGSLCRPLAFRSR